MLSQADRRVISSPPVFCSASVSMDGKPASSEPQLYLIIPGMWECFSPSLALSLFLRLTLAQKICLLPPTAESERGRHQAPLSDDTMRAHTRGAPTVFFISLLWPLLTVAAEEVDPSGGIPFMGGNYEGHPMLYFGRAEVEQLQYAAAGTHRHMARRIREAGESILERPEAYLPPWSSAEYTARWNEVYGNNLGLLSMFCLLYPHRAGALDLAKDYMERMAAQPSWYISYSHYSSSFFFSFFSSFASSSSHPCYYSFISLFIW